MGVWLTLRVASRPRDVCTSYAPNAGLVGNQFGSGARRGAALESTGVPSWSPVHQKQVARKRRPLGIGDIWESLLFMGARSDRLDGDLRNYLSHTNFTCFTCLSVLLVRVPRRKRPLLMSGLPSITNFVLHSVYTPNFNGARGFQFFCSC